MAASSPNSFTCNSIVFDPSPNGVKTLLPGEPLPTTGAALNTASVLTPTVLGNTLYFSAFRTENDGTAFTALYSITNGVLSTLLTNRQANPGIVSVNKLCNGTTVYPFYESTLAAGKYLIFYADVEALDCTTNQVSYPGGLYAYDLTAKTYTLVYPEGKSLSPGDPAYGDPDTSIYLPSVSSLSADGHLLVELITAFDKTTNPPFTYPSSAILYSVNLAQIPTAISLTPTLTSPSYAASNTLTAKVTPNTGAALSASGNVQFFDGTKLLASVAVDSTGTATYAANGLLPASHTLSAVYVGDPAYQGATSANVNVNVTKASTTLTLAAASTSVATGSTTTLTAALATQSGGTPTGSIVFSEGATVLATLPISSTNNAVFTTSALTAGTHTYTVSYAGDSNFNAATTATTSVSAGTPDFNLSINLPTATIPAGQTATFPVTLTPAFGFSQAIALTCSGQPTNTTCTFTPSTLTPNGAPLSSNLVIATNVKSAFVSSPILFNTHSGPMLAFGFGLFLLPLLNRKRRTNPRLLALLLLLSFGGTLAALTGCSSSAAADAPKTLPGTYTLTVTATAGATIHSAPITLTVN
jgi:hypothetical protein